MEFLHILVYFVSVLFSVAWMIFMYIVIARSKIPDEVIDSHPYLKIPILAMLLIFFFRMWYVCVTDVASVVNSVFGLFGCSPIDIKTFG